MKKEILESLKSLEKKEDIKILYACESGSRAWGFASVDSDFDVRFIYVRNKNWYLRVDSELCRDVVKPDIISEFIEQELARFQNKPQQQLNPTTDFNKLNDFFIEALD